MHARRSGGLCFEAARPPAAFGGSPRLQGGECNVPLQRGTAAKRQGVSRPQNIDRRYSSIFATFSAKLQWAEK